MPQKSSNPPSRGRSGVASPPPRMTWGKAAPLFILTVLFDAVRFMFMWFVFFGPALAAFFCTVAGSGTTIGSVLGTKVVGGVCITAAGAAGFFGAGVIETFGMVMAMAVGLIGWMTIGLLLMMFNSRIFKEDAGSILWMLGSLAIAEVPFLGSLPSLTVAMWRLYHVQIKKDKAAFAAYQKKKFEEERLERAQREAEVRQRQMIEAANDAAYEESPQEEPEERLPHNVLRFPSQRAQPAPPVSEYPQENKKAA